MNLLIVDSGTGQELLTESEWKEEPPRVGDIIELHCGETERYVVEEVDWVFEKTSAAKRDDVSLRTLKVLVRPAVEGEGAPVRAVVGVPGEQKDPECECGHRESRHAPMRCTGDAGRCQCTGFKAKA
ncbi:MAG: hypothetical protein IH851_04610 [Armatimonadetes bacterium]|nr:hypothetical protein [Armatimonadota bacterium]